MAWTGAGQMAVAAGLGAGGALGLAAFGLPGWGAVFGAVVLLGLGLLMRTGQKAEARGPQSASPVALKTGFGQALLYRMPAPLLVISQSGRLTYANPAATAILPRIAQGAHYTAMIRAPAFMEALETIREDRQDVSCSFSLMMERERFFEARASMLPAGAGDFGDEDQIIVQVEDRTRDRLILKARSDFIANASHELRTPLASILGYIETLQGHARDDGPARELFLDIMLSQAQRMQRLVDDLMNLSRIEMSAHIRPEEPLDLHDIAAEAAHALFPLASQNEVLLQIEIGSGRPGPTVLGDRDQLSQVVVNLIDNAIKYGGAGTRVRVAAAEPSSKFPGLSGVSVIDEGPGIAREHLHRLTERFFRAGAGSTRDGTGLGLAITKHILTRHSGTLGIESQPGDGSVFTLWLPETDSGEAREKVAKTGT
ncbi:MAG: ATP-binding protein [Pseudomonadota bacterium]